MTNESITASDSKFSILITFKRFISLILYFTMDRQRLPCGVHRWSGGPPLNPLFENIFIHVSQASNAGSEALACYFSPKNARLISSLQIVNMIWKTKMLFIWKMLWGFQTHFLRLCIFQATSLSFLKPFFSFLSLYFPPAAIQSTAGLLFNSSGMVSDWTKEARDFFGRNEFLI